MSHPVTEAIMSRLDERARQIGAPEAEVFAAGALLHSMVQALPHLPVEPGPGRARVLRLFKGMIEDMLELESTP